MSTFQIKAAPFASGTITNRLFTDQTFACSYQVNAQLTTGGQVGGVDEVAAELTKLGITPGTGWWQSAPTYWRLANYVISKIACSHTRAVDIIQDVPFAKVWDITLFIEPQPLLLMPEILFQTSHYQETVLKNQKNGTKPNFAGTPIVNTAGDPFATAIEENKGHLRFEISRGYDPMSFDLEMFKAAMYRKSARNHSFKWMGAQYRYVKNQLYCTDVRMPFKWDPVPHFWVTLAFEIDDGTTSAGNSQADVSYWVRHPISKGFRQKDKTKPNGLPLIQCKEGHGVLHGGEGMLDESGYQMMGGEPGAPLTISPVVMDIETIPEFDFKNLHLFPGD